MKLTFEYTEDLGEGKSPQALHLMDNSMRIIYLDAEGTVLAKAANPILGLYDSLDYKEIGRVSPDTGVTYPSLKKTAHYGAFGFWSSQGDHKFVKYMLPTLISQTFEDGILTYSIGSEVSQFSGTFLNLKGELINRYQALVTPNTRLEIYYSIGSDEIALGQFYIDRASCSFPDNLVSVSARNTIGKLLKEQFFDEDNLFEMATLQENLKAVLDLADIDSFFVSDSTKTWKLKFEPQINILDGLKQIVQQLPGWKIDETLDGTIGLGPYTDARFDQPSSFTFYRDKTCWSYNVEYDDANSVSRICVTCKEPVNQIFVSVPYSKWWVSPAKRTMYVEVADGTSLDEMQEIAEDMAGSISITGRNESFVGIFTPQLILGDEVRMIDSSGKAEVIGTVTDVKHHIGRKEFYTEFTVDSGGRKGKPRLSDLVGQLSKVTSNKGVTIINS